VNCRKCVWQPGIAWTLRESIALPPTLAVIRGEKEREQERKLLGIVDRGKKGREEKDVKG